MEMAERMGYIFHPSPPLFHAFYFSFSTFPLELYFSWNISLSTLSRIFDAVFSLSFEAIHQFSAEATYPRPCPIHFFFFFFSFSFFVPCICATVNLSPDLGYSFSLKVPLGRDFSLLQRLLSTLLVKSISEHKIHFHLFPFDTRYVRIRG